MTNPLFPKRTALFGQNGWILAIVFSVRELVVFCTMTSSWSIKQKKTTRQIFSHVNLPSLTNNA